MKAKANTNIALIKYWGKRDTKLNLPMNSSLSLTLDAYYTVTEVSLDDTLSEDIFHLDGTRICGKPYEKVTAFVDKVRQMTGVKTFARITSVNHVPTAAGFASSASGFAALAGAASRAYDLTLSMDELSVLARHGSGSACRSVYDGFVLWDKGIRDDGSDAFAHRLLPAQAWPLSVIAVVTDITLKPLSSTEGMVRTVTTSPMYQGWLQSIDEDLILAQEALEQRDFEKLGTVTEHNCLKMHSTMMTAIPPIIYWNSTTMAVIQEVTAMRRKGIEAYFTIDAGPNVKVLCQKKDEKTIVDILAQVPGVRHLNICHQGKGLEYM